MSTTLSDHDPVWREPDPKIISLHEKLMTLQHSIGMMPINTAGNPTSVSDAFDEINDRICELELQMKYVLLVSVGRITGEEVKRLIKMRDSVDPESVVVANETLTNLWEEFTNSIK